MLGLAIIILLLNITHKHYSQALATARIWFYAITTSSVGGANISRNPSIPRTSPSTLLRWILTLPLVDDNPTYPLSYRGKATLRPGGASGGYPTIDLSKDDNKETHKTPLYLNITEVKFKYKDKENKDPKPSCPPITPTENDREAIDRLIDDNIQQPQTRPGGKPVSKPVSPVPPSPTPAPPTPAPTPWWKYIPVIPIPSWLNPFGQKI